MSPMVMVCGMSRTGTTLMATVLDSHPDISMGYELRSPGLPPAATTAELLAGVADAAPRAAAEVLERDGHPAIGKLVRRAWRASVDPSALHSVIAELLTAGVKELDDDAAQVALCRGIVEHKAAAEGARMSGYKLNTPAMAAHDAHLPDALYVYLRRDPRDVLASHLANDFGKTPEQVAAAWRNYENRFDELVRLVGSRAKAVRYEDLVADGEAVTEDLAGWLGLDDHTPMRSFIDSKASVHRSGHVNAEQLRRDFFTTSIGRWVADLPRTSISTVQQPLVERGTASVYAPVDLTGGTHLGRAEMDANRLRLRPRVKFHRGDYEALVAPYVEGRDVLTLSEAMGVDVEGREKVTYIRHDIDHDIESAVQIGRWEHEQGIRSTFCVLHTAWYYGAFVDGAYVHGREMVDALLELQSLGHEINLHNNMVTQGLVHGVDPNRLLAAELGFLRLEGLDIRGTSTHGDALCRDVGYFNLELFRETPWHSKGGRRVITHDGRSVELGQYPMATFGLEYEAYDMPRDLYITDSGGRPRIVKDTRGRNGLRRREMQWEIPHGHVVGILTHPLYWDMTTNDLGLDGYPDMDQLEAEHEIRREENRARRRADANGS